MSGSLDLPTARSKQDYSSGLHYVINGMGDQRDGKTVEAVVLLSPATNAPYAITEMIADSVALHDTGNPSRGAVVTAAGEVLTTTAAPDQYTRSDTFTAAANGVTVDATANPGLVYTLQVKATGATPTHWNVVLEGSLDGTNWTTLLTHADTTPDVIGVCKSATARPMLYFRTRCASITLGSATNIIATLLALR